jgi:hypothetical protein
LLKFAEDGCKALQQELEVDSLAFAAESGFYAPSNLSATEKRIPHSRFFTSFNYNSEFLREW